MNPLSDFDRKSLAKYAVYLSRDLEISNKGITVDTKKNTEKLSSVSAASTNPLTKTIYLNSNGGFSSQLNNVNQFKNILKHEIYHVDNAIDGISGNYENHADVYLKQMKHDTFKNSTLPFKANTAGSFVNYLLNIDQDYFRRNLDYNHETMIISRINQFNAEHIGVMSIVAPEYGKYFLGKLSLILKVEGYDPVNINYTYEKN